jgi:hypothetical protein
VLSFSFFHCEFESSDGNSPLKLKEALLINAFEIDEAAMGNASVKELYPIQPAAFI